MFPMKRNNMTNQNQPGQQNQAPGQKPGQQQGGGPKPGQQSQAPGKGDRNPMLNMALGGRLYESSETRGTEVPKIDAAQVI